MKIITIVIGVLKTKDIRSCSRLTVLVRWNIKSHWKGSNTSQACNSILWLCARISRKPVWIHFKQRPTRTSFNFLPNSGIRISRKVARRRPGETRVLIKVPVPIIKGKQGMRPWASRESVRKCPLKIKHQKKKGKIYIKYRTRPNLETIILWRMFSH